MSGLPKGWAIEKLDKCTTITMGQSPKGIYINSEGEGIPFYQGKSEFGKLYPTPKKYCTEPSKLAIQDDILLSVRAPVGPTNLCPETSCIGRGLASIRALEPMSQMYFLHYIRYLQPWLSEQGTGTTFKAISGTFLKDIEVIVAPLNEQIRIANKLDSILAKVDKAQARLDKIPAILKRFRQSVLAAATTGELTREWREELGFTKDNWLPTSIDSLSVRAFDGPFGSKLKTADYTDHGIKVARLENIGHLVFNSEKQTFISETKYQELVKNTIEHNDVLFSSFVDEEIRTCLFDVRFGTHINKADCFCIRPNQEIVSPEFLMYSLASKHTYEKIKKQVHGATRPRVNLRFLKSFEIALPSLKEQLVVVDKINQLFSKANKVEKQYLDAKARLDRLTQSILAKAFRGELVAQAPNDEPADKLLERIVAKKEQNKSKKTTRKRPTKAKTVEKE